MKDPNTLTGWNDKINSIIEQWKTLSENEQSKLLAMLQQKNFTEQINNLKWDKDKIIDYLKTKCFEKKEWVTEYWEVWTHYYLTLPTANWSEYKKIEWFTSKRRVTKKEYEKNETWKSNSSTVEEISTKILWNIHNFLWELGVSEDVNMNFAKELFQRDYCDTWLSLKEVTGLIDSYWLKDTSWNYRYYWNCCGWKFSINENCSFSLNSHDDTNANLFLWLSVS